MAFSCLCILQNACFVNRGFPCQTFGRVNSIWVRTKCLDGEYLVGTTCHKKNRPFQKNNLERYAPHNNKNGCGEVSRFF